MESKYLVRKILRRILFGLIPGQCILCYESTSRLFDLCDACQRDLPKPQYPCWQCGLDMPEDREVCRDCARNPPPFSHCFSAFRYQAPIDRLMNQFKTQGKLILGQVMSQVLAESYEARHLIYPDLWVPVPLHRSRLMQRGFNQAMEIAQVLADITQIPVQDDICERIKATLDQKQLSQSERAKNITSAFRVIGNLEGKSIGLVDDVVTSGATTAELSRKLIAAGASDVQVICLARTPK